MKFTIIVISAFLIAGCGVNQDAASVKPPVAAAATPVAAPSAATTPAALALDTSTPDRALKSYWRAKDALRQAEAEWSHERYAGLKKITDALGIDNKKLMTGETLAKHESLKARELRIEQFNRDIVDIKQDTESRATAMVSIKNSTPLPAGAVISDSDKKTRDKGITLRYVLEKEADGWKVAQVYEYVEYRRVWEKVFPTPTRDDYAPIYVWTSLQ